MVKLETINEIPEIYTDTSSDSSDDESIKALIPTKTKDSISKSEESTHTTNNVKFEEISESSSSEALKTPEKMVKSTLETPKNHVDSAGSTPKSPKSPKASPKKVKQYPKNKDKEVKSADKLPKKESKKAVKKQESKVKKTTEAKDHAKDLLKDSIDHKKEINELLKEHEGSSKEDLEVSSIITQESKKKAKKPKNKSTEGYSTETTSPEKSESTSPIPKKVKKAPSPKVEAKLEGDKMHLDKPETAVVEKAEKSVKSDKDESLKRKTEGDKVPKPKKTKANKSAKPVETGQKSVKPKDSKVGDKVEEVKKAESVVADKKKEFGSSDKNLVSDKKIDVGDKTVKGDRMSNDDVFDALSKFDDLPLGDLKSKLMALASSDSDSSDSDSDSATTDSDSESDDRDYGPSEVSHKHSSKPLSKDSDDDSDDSDEDSDVFIRPAKPSVQKHTTASGLNGSAANVAEHDVISTDSDDGDESDDSVRPAKPTSAKSKHVSDKASKESLKRDREESVVESEEEPSFKVRATESSGDQFINKERIQSTFKTKPDIPEGCEIYCGNLPVNITEDELRELFEDCGLITRINKLNKKGIAFITFSTQESAQKAAEYNNSPYKGQLLNINITSNRPPKPKFSGRNGENDKFNPRADNNSEEPSVTNEICIRNLNYDSSEEGLRELFSECGQVTRCYLPKFQDSGKPMGICFITFTTVEAAKRAVEYDKTEIDGRTVSIQYAMPRNRTGFRGRGTKGRFTTGSSRVATFSRSSSGGSKFGKDNNGKFNGSKSTHNGFVKSTAASGASEGLEAAKPKSILFEDEDDE